jgi:phosphoglycerate kinase
MVFLSFSSKLSVEHFMQKIIIGNWKENPENFDQAKQLLAISKKYKANLEQKNIFLLHAVPTIFAKDAVAEYGAEGIILQNISQHENGSHTGDISVKQMKSLGINMSLVGHSETRLSPENPHGDEDQNINQKIKRVFANQAYATLCVGEYTRENSHDFLDYIQTQVDSALKQDGKEDLIDLQKIIFAYEPVWAIGKKAKRAASNTEILETISGIKRHLAQKYNHQAKVLYGGSVDENNIQEVMNLENTDGALVGRASCDPEKWEKLLQNLLGKAPTISKKFTTYRKISDLNISIGDYVLLRLDLNVPTSEQGEVLNDFRIRESLQTIKYLQEKKARTIILAHKEKGSLKNIAKHIQEKIKLENFRFVDNITGSDVENAVKTLQAGEILLLDNLRLDEREKKNDPEFAKYFVDLTKQSIKSAKSLFGVFAFGTEKKQPGLYYLNEAFSASHRNHASIVGIPKKMREQGLGSNLGLGFKFAEEIEKLSLALVPKHPMFLLVGGAKFDTKLNMLQKFANIADNIFVGGALAHNFWKQKFQYNLGKSLFDEEVILDEKILQEVSKKIILPIDVVVESRETKKPSEIIDSERIVDFGEATLQNINLLASSANTVVWNGPVGFYEGGFEWGTKNLLLTLSRLQSKYPEKVIILGGGDTVTEIDKLNQELVTQKKETLKFTHVSTGGGAMIEFLSNGTLPGLEAVTN